MPLEIHEVTHADYGAGPETGTLILMISSNNELLMIKSMTLRVPREHFINLNRIIFSLCSPIEFKGAIYQGGQKECKQGGDTQLRCSPFLPWQ